MGSPFPVFDQEGAILLADSFAYLYQDSAGSAPVTDYGQPCGRIADRSGRGFHATQSTAGERPTVIGDIAALGAELVSNGSFASGTGWTPGTGWAIGSGVATATASSNALTTAVTVTAGKTYLVTFDVTAYT